MKRLMIISLFLTVFATGCFFYEEAETVNPADVTSTNTGTAPGGVTTFTATVSSLTETNPVITIRFDSPVWAGSVNYDTSIIVEYPIGTPLTEGSGYDAWPSEPLSEATSVIYLDLNESTPTSTTTVRVTLTSSLAADSDSTHSLTLSNYGDFDLTLP